MSNELSVEIDAGGRRVKITAGSAVIDPGGLTELAQQVWQATEGAKHPAEGHSAVGFQVERRPTDDVNPLATGGYTWPGQVNA